MYSQLPTGVLFFSNLMVTIWNVSCYGVFKEKIGLNRSCLSVCLCLSLSLSHTHMHLDTEMCLNMDDFLKCGLRLF